MEELPIVCDRQPVDHLQLRTDRLRRGLEVGCWEARFDHVVRNGKERGPPFRRACEVRSQLRETRTSKGTCIPRRTCVDHAGAEGDDGEALQLELHGPLDRRDVLCRLGHPVCGHVADADAADELGVHACRADDDDALRDPRAQEG